MWVRGGTGLISKNEFHILESFLVSHLSFKSLGSSLFFEQLNQLISQI
jgi:hypothetical protein